MKKEIVSFNESVPEMSSLLELEAEELSRIVGGISADCVVHCGVLHSCGEKGIIIIIGDDSL